MYLRKISPDFVANKLSLNRIRQGYVTSFSASIVSYNSTKSNLFHKLYNSLQRKKKNSFFIQRDLQITDNMGSSISRGRKFSPTKNESSKNPTALLGHAKFCYADLSQKILQTINSARSQVLVKRLKKIKMGDSPEIFDTRKELCKRTEFIESIVCKENEIEENQMKVVDVGDEGGKALLIKQKGKICALGTKCTHYGAPLVNGYLGDGRIRCQWHGACFNISNGDIEDFPGLDSLPCYEVKLSDGNVIVRANKELLTVNKRVRPFVSTIQPTKATFLVVGGGPAGTTCVENLRAQGFDGRIVFIMAEKYLPYDRIKLSKAIDIEVEKIILRSLEFYQERNIEIKQNTKLSALNPYKKMACLDNGDSLKYDKIFLATGATPRFLNVAGCELKNIFVLRTADDAKEIKQALNEISNVVILGTSFIGMEAAAYCVNKVNSVTVVGRDVPFKAAFGSIIGNRILRLFEENKVSFRLQQSIESFEGNNGVLTSVCLSDGTKLPADVCLLGIGTTSNTYYLNSSGIHIKSNGTVEVNEYLQTEFPEVFAGGDIAMAPVLGQKASIGHWGLASYHGYIAAFNMLGQQKPLKVVPFFWTMFFGKGFRYTGYTTSFDDIIIDGSVEELKFIAFYCSGSKVVAVTTINRDPLAAKFAEMLYQNKELQKGKISEWLS